MLKFLYIDNAKSIDDIRVAERTIWAKEIPRMGHEVIFLLLGSHTSEEIISGRKLETYSSSSYIRTVFCFIFKLLKLLKNYKFDFIVLRNKADLGILSFIISKLNGTRLIYIKAFPLLEFKVKETKGVRRICNRILLCLEVVVIRYAEILIIRTKPYADLLREKYNIKREFCIVPMGLDVEFVNNIRIERSSIDFFKNQNKTGIYFGTLAESRNIDFIISVLEILKLNNKKINFIIAGGTEDEISKLENMCNLKKLEVVFFAEMERSQLFRLIQKCDFSLSPIPPIEEYIISSPTKVIESLALECPVIGNKEIIDQCNVIVDSKGGIIVDYDVNQFSNAIIDLIDNKYNLKEMRLNGKEYVCKNRSYKSLAYSIMDHISHI